MNKEKFISILNISKHFGDVVAVDNVSIDIKQGEFFSLLGPSGCGKTTLLRMLAGFEFPTSGDILLDSNSIIHLPPNNRPTNMVFQNYAIFPHLNVEKNIAFGLRVEKLSKEEISLRVKQALEQMKLSGFEKRLSDQLSGGQRQRIALARAIVKRPKVLLLDEPLGALDKKLREEMQLELRILQKNLGITFIFVTHDQEEALTMSDRIAVMDLGKVLQVSSPSELYESPVNQTVANFIGKINIFGAKVINYTGGTALIDIEGLGQNKVQTEKDFVTEGKLIKVAIRPEKFFLAKNNDDQESVSGKLEQAGYLGDRIQYHLHVNNLSRPILIAIESSKESVESLNNKNITNIQWDRDSLVLLPN